MKLYITACLMGIIGMWTHASPAFRLAASRGQLSQVKRLLPNTNVEEAGYGGKTALFLATEQGHTQVVKYIIENSKKASLQTVSTSKDTLMHAAARSGNPEVVSLLKEKLKEKELTSMLNTQNAFKETPLHIALYRPSKTMAITLVETGADPNISFEKGFTALHVAVLSNDYELTIKLINHGAQVSREAIELSKSYAEESLTKTLQTHRETKQKKRELHGTDQGSPLASNVSQSPKNKEPSGA